MIVDICQWDDLICLKLNDTLSRVLLIPFGLISLIQLQTCCCLLVRATKVNSEAKGRSISFVCD